MTAAELADYIATLFPAESFPTGVPAIEVVNHSWFGRQSGQVGAILEGLATLSLDGIGSAERLQVAEIRADLEHARQRWATQPGNIAGQEYGLGAQRVAKLYHLLRMVEARDAGPIEGRGLTAERRYAHVELDPAPLANGLRLALKGVSGAFDLRATLSWTHADGLDESKPIESPDELAEVELPPGASNQGVFIEFRSGRTGTGLSVRIMWLRQRIKIVCSGTSTSTTELDALFVAFETSLGLTRLGGTSDVEPASPSVPPFLATMDRLVPPAAAAYRQARDDLRAERLSYRGPANELRQALWEVLHTLAPDDAVTRVPGYQNEKGQKGPTLRQRAAYVMTELRGEAASETELDQIEHAAALARVTYTRSNKSTHSDHGREEALQVQRWIEAVLRDLLQEPKYDERAEGPRAKPPEFPA